MVVDQISQRYQKQQKTTQTTVREYKIAKGWAIFIYLFAPLLSGIFVWLVIDLFLSGVFSQNSAWIIIPVSITIITLMILGVLDVYKTKYIIKEDCIIYKSIFTSRALKFDEIKGYTFNEHYIIVESKEKHLKKIKISKYTGKFEEIFQWLSHNYPDLDLQNAIDEEQEILNNEAIGWTRELREERLKKERQLTKVINWAASIIAAWIICYPIPYQYLMLAAIMIPIIAIFIIKFSDGLIRIDEKNRSAYPSLTLALIFPTLGLMLRAIFDFNIFEYSNAWIPSTIMTLAILILLLIKQQEITFKKKHDYINVLSLGLFIFVYSFGTVIHFNCFYDHSEAAKFSPAVLDKRISSGSSETYYVKLSAWGQQNEMDEVSVNQDLYKSIEVGDEVNIYFKNGRLGIPWFIVTDK